MRIGKKEFDTENHTYVMGILNVTPDSFSDGGKYLDLDCALFHAEEMVKEGADIIDVGGESSRPGYHTIAESEEIDRTARVLESLCANFDVPISVDTYKSAVAKAALKAGADLVNDIWGLKYDKDMAKVIAGGAKPCVLMHNKEKPEYTDFVSDVVADLKESVGFAKMAGISEDRIIIDPGVGFAKSYEKDLEIIKQVRRLHELKLPILLGASKKSVIGRALKLPVNERAEGTLAVTVMAVISGCSFVRVHDVKENLRAIRMAEAVLRAGEKTWIR